MPYLQISSHTQIEWTYLRVYEMKFEDMALFEE